jgi:hypothetical protein
MSTRAQQAQIIRNAAVLDQLAGALLAAAVNVSNESETAPNHANRVLWANTIIANPLNAAAYVAPSLMSNPTLAGQAGSAAGESGTPFSDGDIDYVVASLYDTYANRLAASRQQMTAPLPDVAV